MIVVKSYEELGRAPMVGDRVRIVSERIGGGWNSQGLMDKHLGTIMTIRHVSAAGSSTSFNVYMEEDREEWYDGWAWSHNMIEGVVLENVEDFLDDPSTWATEESLDILLT